MMTTRKSAGKSFEEKTYYKWCFFDYDLSYKSWGNHSLKYTLTYGTYRTTRPVPGSLGIFVFGTIPDAKRFFIPRRNSPESRFALFECKVQGPVIEVKSLISYRCGNPKHWQHDTKMTRARRLKTLGRLPVLHRVRAPHNTFSVSAVCLVDRVM